VEETGRGAGRSEAIGVGSKEKQRGKGEDMAFVWKEAYKVDIKEIDDQHKKLIELVGSLEAAMSTGTGRQELDRILQELVSYTASHFAVEERLMAGHGYPEYEEHKAKHEKMTAKVLDLQRQYRAKKVGITIEVMNFLENWLDKHILGTDKKYAPYMKERGVK
jgi:hemerythrin